MAKIISLSQVQKKRQDFERKKQKLVLATGAFDLFHKEHKKFLRAAKKQGDVLLVGLETDERVKKLKGDKRPIWRLEKRLEKVAGSPWVDYVFALPEKFDDSRQHQKLIRKIRPHLLAVSSHTPNQKEKKQILKKFKGKLKIVLPQNLRISTSAILKINKKD